MTKSLVQRAYGIDVTDGRITVVQADVRRGRINYTTRLEEAGPGSEEDIRAVVQEIAAQCEQGRAMASCAVPAQDSFIRPVEAPFPSVKKAVAVFPSVLDVQLPFPLEKCVYEFAGTHKTDSGSVRAVAVAVPEERLRTRLETLRDAGLNPEWLEQEALALWRYSRKIAGWSVGGAGIVLYLGRDRTVLVAGRNTDPLSSYSTQTPWSSSAPDADAFVQRLKQKLAGALGVSEAVDPVFLICGAGAQNSDDLRERLGVTKPHWKVADNAGVYLAQALAHGVLDAGGWCVNLRLGELKHPGLTRLTANVHRRRMTGINISSLALLAVGFASAWFVQQHHESLQQKLRDDASAITGAAFVPKGQEVFIVRQYVDQAGESYRSFDEWMNPVVYGRFQKMVESAHGLGITLDTIAVRPASVQASGSCKDWNDPDVWVQPFRDQAWRIEIERKDAGRDERVRFTMRAQK